MTLYEMTEAAKRLYELLEAEEIDEQTYHDTLDCMGAEEKLLAYVHVQKQLEAEYDAFYAESERIENRMSTLRHRIERLKTAEAEFLQATGQKKAKAGTFEVSLREYKRVAIDDEAEIPAEFLRTKPAETQPDKKAIMAALKGGQTVAGVHIESTVSATVR